MRVGNGNLADVLGAHSSCAPPEPVEREPFTYGIGPGGLSVRWASASRALATAIASFSAAPLHDRATIQR